MITKSIKNSIDVAQNMFNDSTLALMNISDTGLLLLLQNMKNVLKTKIRFNRHYRKYIQAYGKDAYGLNYRYNQQIDLEKLINCSWSELKLESIIYIKNNKLRRLETLS